MLSLPMEPVLAQTNQSRQHTKIPSIYGLEYEQARQRLIAAGWQPQKQHWTYRNELDWDIPAQEWWNKGYWEITSCSQGLVYCSFYFRDVYGNRLLVTTQGQVNATVDQWSLENVALNNENTSQPRDFRYQRVVESDFAVGIAPYNITEDNFINLLNQPIQPGRQTTFYIHGLDSDHNAEGSRFFAKSMKNAESIEQAIMVDWGEGSRQGLRRLGLAASKIPIVGETLANKILESGLKPEEVDLVGHSLGAYVAVEAAKYLWEEKDFSVNSVTLLDSANVFTTKYRAPELQTLSLTTSILAIYDLVRGGQNPSNDPEYARTAHRSIGLKNNGIDLNPRRGHGEPIYFYGELLEINPVEVINDIRNSDIAFIDIFPEAQFVEGSPTGSHVILRW
ncbi:hypothetical protein AWQ24_00815 [Picosynechococcus sp. PCC 8807]|nr:hypothetical protein AWQ24_00815 [Picosynechococcus sp. PCC 8807]